METIALCINCFNDRLALEHLLATSAPYFDRVFAVHSGPNGEMSSDGTIEVLQAAGVKIVYADIRHGFGQIRTLLIHGCECDWAFIADCDESFFPETPVLHCEGTERYPAIENPNLTVTELPEYGVFKQGELLRQMCNSGPEVMCIKTRRRHWFDLERTRACENWMHHNDYQLRVVRNSPYVRYDGEVKMHERLIDVRSGSEPFYAQPSHPYLWPHHDHFHCYFKALEPEKKVRNEANYRALEQNRALT